MKQFLISGFDAFGGAATNASEQLVLALKKDPFVSQIAELVVLPTSYQRSWEELERAIRRVSPAYFLGFGEAGGRTAINFERVGVNIQDALLPDNDNSICQNEFVVPDGPAAYFASIPIERLTRACSEVGVPAKISYSAGTFVCNALLYQALHATRGEAIKVGFAHLPWLPAAAATRPDIASMSTDTVVSGVRAIIQALSAN